MEDLFDTEIGGAGSGIFPLPMRLSLTLVARTSKEVTSAVSTRTPDLTDATLPDHNQLGDHAGTDLPVTDVNSPFYGNHVYRTLNLKIDLRNLGVGTWGAP
jgi:hypothetical protein